MFNSGYIPSQFFIDEHNARLAQYMGRSAPARNRPGMVRQRISGVLRAVADRIEQAVQLLLMQYPGEAGKRERVQPAIGSRKAEGG